MDSPSSAPTILGPSEVAQSAGKFALGSALSGALFGATTGVIRGTTPILFAGAAAAQWGLLGGTFTTIRTIYLNHAAFANYFSRARGSPLRDVPLTPPAKRETVIASTFAGGVTGASVGWLIRGPRNIIPGLLFFSLAGFTGQNVLNIYSDSRSPNAETTEEFPRESTQTTTEPATSKPQNFLQRIASSKYSPGFKELTNEDYVRRMEEGLLRVEADIAMIDDRIARLRKDSELRKADREAETTEEKK